MNCKNEEKNIKEGKEKKEQEEGKTKEEITSGVKNKPCKKK